MQTFKEVELRHFFILPNFKLERIDYCIQQNT